MPAAPEPTQRTVRPKPKPTASSFVRELASFPSPSCLALLEVKIGIFQPAHLHPTINGPVLSQSSLSLSVDLFDFSCKCFAVDKLSIQTHIYFVHGPTIQKMSGIQCCFAFFPVCPLEFDSADVCALFPKSFCCSFSNSANFQRRQLFRVLPSTLHELLGRICVHIQHQSRFKAVIAYIELDAVARDGRNTRRRVSIACNERGKSFKLR